MARGRQERKDRSERVSGVRTKGATLGRLEGTYAEGKRVVGTAGRKLQEKKRREEKSEK